MALNEQGILDRYDVELIGAKVEAIEAGENREQFKKIVETININGYQAESARSVICHTLEECFAASDELGYPMVVRPSFTMGGAGSGMAYNVDDLRTIAGQDSRRAPPPRCCLRNQSSGGRNTNSNSCATATTTWLWCVRSRTLTRSVFTQVTPSRSPRH